MIDPSLEAEYMNSREAIPQLYYAPGSCSIAPLIALHEAGAKFEAKPVILANGEQTRAEYRAINPHGRVPAIVVDGGVITEVIAILTWVAWRFPTAALLPFEQPSQLAKAYEWMSWYATSLHIAFAQVVRPERYALDQEVWPALKKNGLLNLERSFEEINRMLTAHWALGDDYSVVDPYTLVFWRWGKRLKLNMDLYSNWADHTERMLRRRAVDAALMNERQAEQAGAQA